MLLTGKQVVVVGGSSGISRPPRLQNAKVLTSLSPRATPRESIRSPKNSMRSQFRPTSPTTRASPTCSAAQDLSITSWSARRSCAPAHSRRYRWTTRVPRWKARSGAPAVSRAPRNSVVRIANAGLGLPECAAEVEFCDHQRRQRRAGVAPPRAGTRACAGAGQLCLARHHRHVHPCRNARRNAQGDAFQGCGEPAGRPRRSGRGCRPTDRRLHDRRLHDGIDQLSRWLCAGDLISRRSEHGFGKQRRFHSKYRRTAVA